MTMTSEKTKIEVKSNVSSINGDLIIHSEEERLYVAGDIDLYQVSAFRHASEEHISSVARPTIDLNDVAFLDSAGLATLLYLARYAASNGKSLHISATGGPRRVLRITGIDRLLTLED